jgi:hypothetical protein
MKRLVHVAWWIAAGCTIGPAATPVVAKSAHTTVNAPALDSRASLDDCGEQPALRCWPGPDDILTANAVAGTLEQRFCQPLRFLDDGDVLVACAGSHDNLDRGTLGRLRDGEIRWSIPWGVTSLFSSAVALAPEHWAVARLVPPDVERAADGQRVLFSGRQVAEIVDVRADGALGASTRFDSTQWSQIIALTSDRLGQLVVGGSFKRDLTVLGHAVRAGGYFASFIAKLSPDRASAEWVTTIGGRDTTLSTVVALGDGGVAAIGVGRDLVVASRLRVEHRGYFYFYARVDSRGSIATLVRLTGSVSRPHVSGASSERMSAFIDGNLCVVDGATGAVLTATHLAPPNTAIIELGGAIPDGTSWFAVPHDANGSTTRYDIYEVGSAGIVQHGSIREQDPFYGSLHFFARSPTGQIYATGNLVSTSTGKPYAFASLRTVSQ